MDNVQAEAAASGTKTGVILSLSFKLEEAVRRGKVMLYSVHSIRGWDPSVAVCHGPLNYQLSVNNHVIETVTLLHSNTPQCVHFS